MSFLLVCIWDLIVCFGVLWSLGIELRNIIYKWECIGLKVMLILLKICLM